MTTVSTPSYRQRTAYHATLLGVIALIASAALVLGNLQTRQPIAERQSEDMQDSLRQVIPDALHDNDMLSDTLEIPAVPDQALPETTLYRARKDGVVVGAAFEMVTTSGYAGPILMMMGVDAQGQILGVRVISHTETPGLGDKIETSKGDWILSFNNLTLFNPSPSGWAVKKDGGQFDQFSGATITPRAVVAAVHTGLLLFDHHRAEILNPTPETGIEQEMLQTTNQTPTSNPEKQ